MLNNKVFVGLEEESDRSVCLGRGESVTVARCLPPVTVSFHCSLRLPSISLFSASMQLLDKLSGNSDY